MCARRTRSRRSLTRRSLAGRVDVLFNDAGGQHLMAAEEITPKGFRTAMRLNAKSAC
jgi:NAD(P)-dependent dehydrogenase (short-subunit alcohol dehydrogenase family)